MDEFDRLFQQGKEEGFVDGDSTNDFRLKGANAVEQGTPGWEDSHRTASKYNNAETVSEGLFGEKGYYGRTLGDRRDAAGQLLSHELLGRGQATPTSSANYRQQAIHRDFLMANRGLADRNPTSQEAADYERYIQREKDQLNVARNAPSMDSLEDRRGFHGAAFGRGVDQVQQMGYGLVKLIGDSIGAKSITDFAKAGIDKQTVEMLINPRMTKSFSDADGFSETVASLYESVIEQAPNIGTTIAAALVSGGIGGIAGRQTAAKIASGEVAASTATQRMFQQAITNPTWKTTGVQRLYDLTKKQAISKASQRGAAIGAGATSIGMNTGETKLSFDAEGIDNNAKVFATGLLKGAIDMVGLSAIPGVNRLVGLAARKASRKTGTKITRKDLFKQVPFKVLKAAIAEGGTEGVQQAADIVSINTSLNKAWDEEDTKSLKEAMVIGAVAGKAFALPGAIGGAAFGTVTEPKKQIEAQKQATKEGKKKAVYENDPSVPAGFKVEGTTAFVNDGEQSGKATFRTKEEARAYIKTARTEGVSQANAKHVLLDAVEDKTVILENTAPEDVQAVQAVENGEVVDEGLSSPENIENIEQEMQERNPDAETITKPVQQALNERLGLPTTDEEITDVISDETKLSELENTLLTVQNSDNQADVDQVDIVLDALQDKAAEISHSNPVLAQTIHDLVERVDDAFGTDSESNITLPETTESDKNDLTKKGVAAEPMRHTQHAKTSSNEQTPTRVESLVRQAQEIDVHHLVSHGTTKEKLIAGQILEGALRELMAKPLIGEDGKLTRASRQVDSILKQLTALESSKPKKVTTKKPKSTIEQQQRIAQFKQLDNDTHPRTLVWVSGAKTGHVARAEMKAHTGARKRKDGRRVAGSPIVYGTTKDGVKFSYRTNPRTDIPQSGKGEFFELIVEGKTPEESGRAYFTDARELNSFVNALKRGGLPSAVGLHSGMFKFKSPKEIIDASTSDNPAGVLRIHKLDDNGVSQEVIFTTALNYKDLKQAYAYLLGKGVDLYSDSIGIEFDRGADKVIREQAKKEEGVRIKREKLFGGQTGGVGLQAGDGVQLALQDDLFDGVIETKTLMDESKGVDAFNNVLDASVALQFPAPNRVETDRPDNEASPTRVPKNENVDRTEAEDVSGDEFIDGEMFKDDTSPNAPMAKPRTEAENIERAEKEKQVGRPATEADKQKAEQDAKVERTKPKQTKITVKQLLTEFYNLVRLEFVKGSASVLALQTLNKATNQFRRLTTAEVKILDEVLSELGIRAKAGNGEIRKRLNEAAKILIGYHTAKALDGLNKKGKENTITNKSRTLEHVEAIKKLEAAGFPIPKTVGPGLVAPLDVVKQVVSALEKDMKGIQKHREKILAKLEQKARAGIVGKRRRVRDILLMRALRDIKDPKEISKLVIKKPNKRSFEYHLSALSAYFDFSQFLKTTGMPTIDRNIMSRTIKDPDGSERNIGIFEIARMNTFFKSLFNSYALELKDQGMYELYRALQKEFELTYREQINEAEALAARNAKLFDSLIHDSEITQVTGENAKGQPTISGLTEAEQDVFNELFELNSLTDMEVQDVAEQFDGLDIDAITDFIDKMEMVRNEALFNDVLDLQSRDAEVQMQMMRDEVFLWSLNTNLVTDNRYKNDKWYDGHPVLLYETKTKTEREQLLTKLASSILYWDQKTQDPRAARRSRRRNKERQIRRAFNAQAEAFKRRLANGGVDTLTSFADPKGLRVGSNKAFRLHSHTAQAITQDSGSKRNPKKSAARRFIDAIIKAFTPVSLIKSQQIIQNELVKLATEQGSVTLTKKDIMKILDKAFAQNNPLGMLYKRIFANLSDSITVDLSRGLKFVGKYKASGKKVILITPNGNKTVSEGAVGQALMHELMHAATMHHAALADLAVKYGTKSVPELLVKFQKGALDKKLTAREKRQLERLIKASDPRAVALAQDILEIHKAFKSSKQFTALKAKFPEANYATAVEFMASALTNTDMMNALDTIPATKELYGSGSLLDSIINAIARFFGWGSNETMLKQMFKLMPEVAESEASVSLNDFFAAQIGQSLAVGSSVSNITLNDVLNPRQRIPFNRITQGIKQLFTKEGLTSAGRAAIDKMLDYSKILHSSSFRLGRISSELANAYYAVTGSKADPSKAYLNKFHSYAAQFKGAMHDLYKDMSSEQKQQMFDDYYMGKETADSRKLRRLIKRFHNFLAESDVESIRKTGERYGDTMPLIWDMDKLTEMGKDAFVKFLMEGNDGGPFNGALSGQNKAEMTTKWAEAIYDRLTRQSAISDNPRVRAPAMLRDIFADKNIQKKAYEAGLLSKDGHAALEFHISTLARQRARDEVLGSWDFFPVGGSNSELLMKLNEFGYGLDVQMDAAGNILANTQQNFDQALIDAVYNGIIREVASNDGNGTVYEFWNPDHFQEVELDRILRNKGKDAAYEAKKIMDGMDELLGVGLSKGAKNKLEWAGVAQVFMLLAFSTITSLPEIGMALTGLSGKSVSATFAGIKQTLKDPKAAIEFAKMRGIVSESILSAAYVEGQRVTVEGNMPRNALEKFFRYNGNTYFNNFLRAMSLQIGIAYATEKAQENTAQSKKELARWGLTKKEVDQWLADGSPEYTQNGDVHPINIKFLNFVDAHAARPVSANKTVLSNDPKFILLTQFKSFFYAYAAVILPEIGKTMGEAFGRAGAADRGRVAQAMSFSFPLIMMAVTALPLALLANGIKDGIRSFSDDEEDAKWRERRDAKQSSGDKLVRTIRDSGALGPVDLVWSFFDAQRRDGTGISRALGPTAGMIDTIFTYGLTDPRTLKRMTGPVSTVAPGLWSEAIRNAKEEDREERRKEFEDG